MGLLEQIFLGRSGGNSSDSNEMKPFTFHSTKHQRFNQGMPEGSLQICGRSFIVEKNVSGCDGYKLTPGDGWIIRCYNDDTKRPQFAPKPMRVISTAPGKVVLRGYKTQAMSPFGWMPFDGDDYGLEVFFSNGEVVRCIFHMHDRNIRLEYM